MIFWLSKTIAGIFGLDISKVQRIVAISLVAAVLIIVLILGLWLKSCFSKPPKMDEAAILEAQEAVKEKNDERLRQVLANADVKEKIIDGTVANAAANTEAAKVEAKKKYDQMNAEELAKELESRK